MLFRSIVALGGYKIIKKIQAQEQAPKMMEAPFVAGRVEQAEELDQLEELETKELSRIEVWRRGIAEVEAESGGTTVDGEFITPGASRHLVDAGVLDEEDLKSRRKSRVGEEKERKSRRAKSEKTSRTSGTRTKSAKSAKESSKPKKKESTLRKLFRSNTTQ